MNNAPISGERDPEAREVPAALLPRRRRQERRGVASDPEQRRSWHQIWQVRQAGLSAQAGREALQVNCSILLVHLPSFISKSNSHLMLLAAVTSAKETSQSGVSWFWLIVWHAISQVSTCLCCWYQPTIPKWNWVKKLSPSLCLVMVSCRRRDVVFVNSHHTVRLSLTHSHLGCESFSVSATLVHCTGDKCLIVISVW